MKNPFPKKSNNWQGKVKQMLLDKEVILIPTPQLIFFKRELSHKQMHHKHLGMREESSIGEGQRDTKYNLSLS